MSDGSTKLPLSPLLGEFPQSFVIGQLAGTNLSVTAEQVADFQRFNQIGDPVADRLAAWMRTTRGNSHRLFENALEHGIDTLDNPSQELVDFFAAIDEKPYWLDQSKLELGARLASTLPPWVFQPALIAGLCISYLPFRSNQVLIRAGDLKSKAGKRMVETTAWWLEVTEVNGLDRFSPGFKSSARVRLTHAFIRSAMDSRPDWDREKWNLAVPQSIYAVTIFMFGMMALAAASVLGMTPTAKERDAYLHMWRYIGFLVGVHPELNPADRGDSARLASVALHTEIDIDTPDPAAVELTAALMDSVPLVYGITGEGTASKLAARALKRAHQEFTRLVIGEVAGEHLGLPPISPLTGATLSVSGANFLANVIRQLIPATGEVAANVGVSARREWIKRAAERTKADLSYSRDDSDYTPA